MRPIGVGLVLLAFVRKNKLLAGLCCFALLRGTVENRLSRITFSSFLPLVFMRERYIPNHPLMVSLWNMMITVISSLSCDAVSHTSHTNCGQVNPLVITLVIHGFNFFVQSMQVLVGVL